MWQAEEIPGADHLFLRVHKANVRDGFLIDNAFQEFHGGMSTNWSKYSTPEITRDQVAELPPRNGKLRDPKVYGVVSLKAEAVRAIPNVSVEHTPDWERNNRAHTDVHGSGENPADEDETEVRFQLRKIWAWCLHPILS
jgi:hypothetical protein